MEIITETNQAKIFKDWLKTNEHLFNHKPYVFKQSEGVDLYRFNGLLGEIILLVDDGNASIDIIEDENKFTDILLDGVVYIEKEGEKYYCMLCEERKYYSSIKSLLIDHSFKVVLTWINKLNENHYLHYYGHWKNDGFSGVDLREGLPSKLDMASKYFRKYEKVISKQAK